MWKDETQWKERVWCGVRCVYLPKTVLSSAILFAFLFVYFIMPLSNGLRTLKRSRFAVLRAWTLALRHAHRILNGFTLKQLRLIQTVIVTWPAFPFCGVIIMIPLITA